MSIEESLNRVERDIAAGDYGKARERLHGLVGAHPYRLELRRRLGDVYAELRYPAMAGRYWYLEEVKSAEMEAACRVFEESCGRSPVLMLQALKFKGDIDRVRETFAGRTLVALARRAEDEHGYKHVFGAAQTPAHAASLRETLAEKLLPVGCALVVLTCLTLMVVGLITILRALFR